MKDVGTVESARAAFPRRLCVTLGLFVLLFTAVPASSQETGLRLGGLRLTPTVTISVESDSNVLNDDNPKQDWTTASSLSLEARARVGIAGIRARSALDAMYYNTHTERRSVGGRQEVEAEFYLARLRPFMAQSYGNVRTPFSVEVDLPVRRLEMATTVGADFKMTALTTIRGQVDRRENSFANDALYRGVELAAPLNLVSEKAQVSLLHDLTPLTKLSVTGELQQDRFEFQPSRNGDSLRVSSGVTFQPYGLISGSANVGYRRFTFPDPLTPPFRGLVASVDLSFRLLNASRLNVRMGRDVPYSMSPDQPYFVSSLLGASLAHDFRDNWEVEGEWRRDKMAYQHLSSIVGGIELSEALGTRTDYVHAYGAAVRRRFNRRLRLDVNFRTNAHESSDKQFAYSKFTMGSSVVYGF